MTPGRELDALISEKIFVVRADYRTEYTFDGKTEIRHYSIPTPGDWAFTMLPHYSTDIKAAWEVVEKLGYGWNIDKGNDTEHEFVVYFSNPEGQWKAVGDTAPHAICLAALKAIEVKGNK